jgi:large subunit ribosomal protein L17
MKKRVFGKKLSRERDTRRALFRSLSRALFMNSNINTTKAKAMAVTPFAEKVLRKVRQGNNLTARRMVISLLANDRVLADKIFERMNPDFPLSKRFITVIPLPNRKGDSAEMVRLSLAEGLFKAEVKEKEEEKAKAIKEKKEAKPAKVKKEVTKKVKK